ncbi:MAG: GNAT family N-acetyltransferase [SAR202 cluster bacterium]|nr:GNAT family N-acetyltransferase [SAR202 cluster bacterium]
MTQPAFTIRPGTPSDADALTGFAVAMGMETEGKRLDPGAVRVATLAALEDPTKALFFVAESEGKAVGSLMVTYEWSDWENGDYWWIQSVYIDPAWRRKGIYRALYRHVYYEGERRGDVVGIKLYVYKDNHRAMKTYESLGMKKAPHFIYEVMLPGWE